MEGNDDTGSAVSEREVAAVTLNLARLHDLIDDRRAAAVQAARTFCHEEHIPSVAILSNESLQVRGTPAGFVQFFTSCHRVTGQLPSVEPWQSMETSS